MIAACPSCARRWVLPAERVGPGGARVRCAACDHEFAWSPSAAVPRFDLGAHPWSAPAARVYVEPADLDAFDSGVAEPTAPAAHASSAVAELDDADATPPMVARLAVEELALEGGPAMLAAWDEGRLFEQCGPMILRAWDHCRQRLGGDADPAAFREALRARLGIDLPDGSLR